jgi:hypothetical protein
VVASERQERAVPYLEFERHGCPKWQADMLEGSFQRVFVAGNHVLCVSSVSGSHTASELVRLLTLFSCLLTPFCCIACMNECCCPLQGSKIF